MFVHKPSISSEVIYFATDFTDPLDKIVLHPEDHSEYIWVSEAELSQVYTDQKGADDTEFQALKKAFALLHGDTLDFATL